MNRCKYFDEKDFKYVDSVCDLCSRYNECYKKDMFDPKETTEIEPIHPGEILQQEFLIPQGITIYDLSEAIGVPMSDLVEIIEKERDISPEVAKLLSKHLGTSPNYWTNLQAHFDKELNKDPEVRITPCPKCGYDYAEERELLLSTIKGKP